MKVCVFVSVASSRTPIGREPKHINRDKYLSMEMHNSLNPDMIPTTITINVLKAKVKLSLSFFKLSTTI
jgi:hypothetical protein